MWQILPSVFGIMVAIGNFRDLTLQSLHLGEDLKQYCTLGMDRE